MSAFKEFYDVLKDLIGMAKKAKNQEVINLALDLQEKFFELREENDNLNAEIKELNNKIKKIEESVIIEDDIEYSERGFFTLKKDKIKMPYCSMCWKKNHVLIPLSQQKNWYQYRCGNCKTDCIVMTNEGKAIGEENRKNSKTD